MSSVTMELKNQKISDRTNFSLLGVSLRFEVVSINLGIPCSQQTTLTLLSALTIVYRWLARTHCLSSISDVFMKS